jgi:pimeloyl-ACP methyl ester carboxylesterase
MSHVQANGLTLEYESFGSTDHPCIMLVAGLGAQLIDWSVEFCELLARGGYRVIRFDNRDAGLSSGLDHLGTPDLDALFAGRIEAAPYLLADFARDTVGLLDALVIDRAHLVGASMGGMIVQQAAIDHPDRLLSLCSIMSTTGDPSVGQPAPEVAEENRLPPDGPREQIIAHYVRDARRLASPGFAPPTDAELQARFSAKYDRSYRPQGRLRQYCAIVASGDRTLALGAVTVPTLVIHGAADPRIDVSGGWATARAIPGADLLVIGGMGHGQPRGAAPRLVSAIIANARRAAAPPQ